jgi:N-acetyl sugar amidotransferase
MLLFPPDYTLDKQLDKLPKEVKFCKKCVVSNQRPRIIFDEEGVCSACRYAEEKESSIDWADREKQLRAVCDKFRSKDGSYDCIVPSSGGKDSGFVAHQLKYEYGMHPLLVTWAPFEYTQIGFENFIALKDAGFDNILVFPDGRMHKKLARLAFELVGDAWQPFTYGQKALAYQMAAKFKVPLIFYGENGEIEYGGSTKYKNKPYEDIGDYKELYFKGAGVDEVVNEGLRVGYLTQDEVDNNRLEMYKIPPVEDLENLGLQMHWFSYYKKWIPQENYYYCVDNTGFVANDERSEGTYSKYASLDDKLDGFHFYPAYYKFGICRATSDAAHEVRDGHLTREDAIALVKRYDGEFPKKYFDWFLKYLDITEDEFHQILEKYRNHNVWKNVEGEWKLRHNVWGEGCED